MKTLLPIQKKQREQSCWPVMTGTLFLLLIILPTANAGEGVSKSATGDISVARQARANPEPESLYTRNERSLAVPFAPYGTNGIPDLVPKHLVFEAVRLIAASRWPIYAIGTPIPCVDKEGMLIAYQVPVRVGTNRFPEVLAPPPASEISAYPLRTPSLWAMPDYWTFVVSARRSQYPVPVYGEGLPAFLVTFHKAREKAQSELGSAHVSTAHYYWLGHNGEYYDFVSESGQRLLVNAHTLQSYAIPIGGNPLTARNAFATAAQASPVKNTLERELLRRNYQKQVQEEWDRISSNADKTRD